MFPDFPAFLVPGLSPLPGFDSLNVFPQKGTKNTGYAWLSPCCGLVTQTHGLQYINDARLTTVKRRERLCDFGGYNL